MRRQGTTGYQCGDVVPAGLVGDSVPLDLKPYFAGHGPLAKAIPGYRFREQQLEMAQAILDAIEREGVVVAEAGTGTGKTVAYLVPALLAGGKVIVSTGTKNLQDQLFHRDIPAVRRP